MALYEPVCAQNTSKHQQTNLNDVWRSIVTLFHFLIYILIWYSILCLILARWQAGGLCKYFEQNWEFRLPICRWMHWRHWSGNIHCYSPRWVSEKQCKNYISHIILILLLLYSFTYNASKCVLHHFSIGHCSLNSKGHDGLYGGYSEVGQTLKVYVVLIVRLT